MQIYFHSPRSMFGYGYLALSSVAALPPPFVVALPDNAFRVSVAYLQPSLTVPCCLEPLRISARLNLFFRNSRRPAVMEGASLHTMKVFLTLSP